MHGARQLVFRNISKWIPPKPARILDLCCGDAEITEELEKYGDVTSVDFDQRRSKTSRHPTLLRDVAYTPWYWARRNSFDVVTCFYAIQHVWGDEAAVWREVRRVLRPGGLFIVTGRYLNQPPRHEMRADPGRSDNAETLHAMGLASGLTQVSTEPFWYTEQGFAPNAVTPNVHFSVFRKGSPRALSWEEAKRRYRLFEVEGWMHEDELRWLYETACGQAGGTVVEIGTFMGKGACSILAGLKEGGGGRLACVDTFDGRDTSRHEEVKKIGVEEMVARHRATTRGRGLPDPFFHVGESIDPKISGCFEKEGVDWLFVDGSHDRLTVELDLKTWKSKVARGGILSGHDYHPTWPGVVDAVNGVVGKVSVVPGTSIWMAEVK